MAVNVDQLWGLARGDVALPSDLDVRLMTFSGRPDPGMPWGSSVEPGCDAWTILGMQYHFTAAEQRQAASERELHQVLVHLGAPAPVVLGLMRHELEHVRQFEQSLYVTRANTALCEEFARITADVPGAFRGLYPLLPAEQDASAAAARLVHQRFDPLALLTVGAEHQSLLFTARSSGVPEGLPARLIGLAAIYPTLFGEAVRHLFLPQTAPDTAAEHLVEWLMPHIGLELYAACMLDGYISSVRDRGSDLIAEAWAGSQVLGPTAWAPVAEALEGVQRRAEALAASPSERRKFLSTLVP